MRVDLGQKVYGNADQELGDIDGVVVNAGTKRARAVLIGRGPLGGRKHMVGVSAIARIDANGVHLGTLAPPADDQAPILASEEVELPERVQPPTTYVGAAGVGGPIITSEPDLPGRFPDESSFFDIAPIDPGPIEVFSNLEENEVALGKQAEVMSSDGNKLGQVVGFELGDMGLVEHVVVSEGFLFKTQTQVPLADIEEFGTNAVHLRVTQDDLASRS